MYIRNCNMCTQLNSSSIVYLATVQHFVLSSCIGMGTWTFFARAALILVRIQIASGSKIVSIWLRKSDSNFCVLEPNPLKKCLYLCQFEEVMRIHFSTALSVISIIFVSLALRSLAMRAEGKPESVDSRCKGACRFR